LVATALTRCAAKTETTPSCGDGDNFIEAGAGNDTVTAGTVTTGAAYAGAMTSSPRSPVPTALTAARA